MQVILHSLFFALGVLAPPPQLNTPMPPADQVQCAEPNREVAVDHATMADYPASAKSLNLGPVTVLIDVTVGASGAVQNIVLYKSSGNDAIDRSAMVASRESTYKPKIVNCVPTTGDYIFRAEFAPGGPVASPLASAPFPAPAFSPPPDWSVLKELPPQNSNRWVYSAWQKGDAVLTLSGIPVTNSLNDIQRRTIGGLASQGAKIVSNGIVPVCGSADALLITYTRHGTDGGNVFIADLYARSTRGIYQIVLYAPGAQTLDSSVEKSLKSLCAP